MTQNVEVVLPDQAIGSNTLSAKETGAQRGQ